MYPESDNRVLKARLVVLSVIAAALLAMSYVTRADIEDEQLEQELYCEMVKQHRKDANTGWPDYREQFAELCTK